MNADDQQPEVVWKGDFIRAIKRGRWEYASRVRNIRAVVVLAMTEGKYVLIEQDRVPIGKRCIELVAGLVGDEDEHATVEGTAVKELDEEAGYTAETIEVIGEFYSSPGMVSEGFTLVRADGLSKVGEGGGTEHENIVVHLVAPDDLPDFIAAKRRQGCGIDVKLLLLLASSIL